MNDLKLADKQSSPAEYFRRKLIEISPFLKKWLRYSSFSSETISSIDRKIQQENDFIESDRLRLFDNQKFVDETTVYFDYKHKQLYVTRPWDSETTFLNLPNKLCQLLNIQGFDKNIRFLLKGTIEEIKKHFIAHSIEIPTNKDIVILESLPKAGDLKQPKPSVTTASESNTCTSHIKDTETSHSSPTPKNNNDHLFALKPPIQLVPQHYQSSYYDSIQVIPPIDQCGRTLPSVLIASEGEQLDNIELINMSSITPSSSVLLHNLSDITREYDELDLHNMDVLVKKWYTNIC